MKSRASIFYLMKLTLIEKNPATTSYQLIIIAYNAGNVELLSNLTILLLILYDN